MSLGVVSWYSLQVTVAGDLLGREGEGEREGKGEKEREGRRGTRMGSGTRRRIHYSYWALAIGTFTKACSSPGQSPFVGVFIDRYIIDLNIKRTVVSLLYFIATMSSAGTLPFVGAPMDKYGLRLAAIFACTGLATTCVIFAAAVRNAVTLLLGFYCLRFFGQGLMSLVGSNIINSEY